MRAAERVMETVEASKPQPAKPAGQAGAGQTCRHPAERPQGRRRGAFVIGKPSLFLALAGTAALSVVAHAAAVAEAPQPTRMGVSIQQSVAERDKDAARRNRALDLREQTARAAEERLKSELQARPQADARAGKAERRTTSSNPSPASTRR
jgi:hypothetical protein